MDVAAITTLITNIGFPISCVIYLFYFLNKREEKQDEKDKQMQDILSNFSLNIQENTLMIKELLNKLNNNKEE